jgi:predicted HicB family RNase H-like nuclease
MLARTAEQKTSQNTYMEKLQDIKVRVPKEYYQTIKNYADSKGTSVNKLIISLLEKEIGTEFLSVREQNKLKKEDLTE